MFEDEGVVCGCVDIQKQEFEDEEIIITILSR